MAEAVTGPVKVRPEPEAVSEVAPPRFVPVTVTSTELPGRPVAGLMPVRVGGVMVKFSPFSDVPVVPVTLTL